MSAWQSLLKGVAKDVEALLEAAPEHILKDDINLIEQISTIAKHLDEQMS